MLSRWILGICFYIFFNIFYVSCARNSSLTFVIDDTRSMWDDIDQVISAAEEIMDIITSEKASEIEDVVLVTFNDPEVVLRTKTSSKAELLQALRSITVHNFNNRDCPEYALSGIRRALHESRHGSYLYVFTDASAKDYYKLNEIKNLCEKKQSQVVFVLTGDCYNPYNERYLVYHEIAKACSGQVFRVDKDEVKDVINTVKETAKGHKSVVTSQLIPATDIWVPVPFAVDDKTEYVLVSVSGSDVGLIIKDADSKDMATEFILWKPTGKMVKFDAPTPGTYYAWVKGNTDISIIVYARTDFTFDHGFSEFEPKSLADTSKQPIADRKHHLSISVTDPDNTVDIKTAEILDMAERVVIRLPLKKTNGNFYITDQFVSPSSMFKIQVTGTIKKTGNVIKRISKTAIEPQIPPKPASKAPEVTITEGTVVDVDYNGEISLTCKVSAYPEPAIVWTTADGTVLSSKSSAVDLPYDYISYLKLTYVKNPGTYYCKASNDQARDKFSKINVKPKSPFVITSTLPGTTQTKYGEKTQLKCGVSSIYPMQIKWNTPLYPSDYSLSSDNKVLTIKSMNIEAQGSYTCEATLKSDPNQKHVVATNVVISDLAPPMIHDTPGTIEVSNGDRLKVLCRTAGGIPQPIISWQEMKNGDNTFRDLPASGEELVINIASLDDAGQYRCLAKNAIGQAGKTTRVIVNKAPVAVIEEGLKKTIAYGSTIDLTCKIVAYPLPKISWRDSNGNNIASLDTINNLEITSRVKIQNIMQSSAYSCYAENGLGNTVSNIDLSVTSPFDVHDHPGATTNTLYGKTTDITCNIKSAFPLKIKWFYQKSSTDKSEIHTSDKYRISPSGTSLRILITNLDLIGKYTCEASVLSDANQKKSFTTDVVITDLSPPVLQNAETKQITVHNKDKVTIPCKIVSGTPPPSVSWQVMRKGEITYRDVSATGKELTLASAELADAGQYRCIATNPIGKADKTTELIVQKAPEAVIDNGKAVTVPYGSTNVFKCRIVAYPLPKIAWTDSKGQKLHSKDFITDHEIISQLEVHNVKSNEMYSCSAVNDLGRTEARIQVSVAPAIVLSTHPAETTGVKYKAPANILCDAKSAFPIKIKWFYQKSENAEIKEIHTSDKYVITPDGSRLHIMSTDLDLVGKYTCEASLVNDENEKQSYTTKVEIIDLKGPEITASDNTITIMNGQKLEASCTASGIPKPKVTWQFKAKNSNVFADIPSLGEKVTNPSISYEWAGLYKCTANNKIGIQSRTIDVDVHGKPNITNDNSGYSGVTGDKVLKIPCEVSGVPEPTITWKRGGVVVTSGPKLILDKNALIIKNPTEKDSSNFTCEAKNKYGDAKKDFRAEISDFIDFDENLNTYIYLKLGESKDIKCNLPNSDPQSVRWYVNNDKNFERGSSYSIRDAKYANDGNYTCRVNTDQGSESLNYVVDVGYEPSFINKQISPIVNWNGNTKETLDCNVDAKPREKAAWLYNGKALDSAETELYISGWGEYSCNVSNVHGSVLQTFNVTSAGCVINTTVDRVQNIPLLINDEPSTWPKLYKENEFIILKQKDPITLTCSTKDQPNNTFKTNPSATERSVECYKEDQFIVEGKILKFQDLECKDYVRSSLVLTKKPCMKNGEIIEVGFKLNNGFLGVYDICYSEADSRTLYTKVSMSDANVGNIVGPSFKLNQRIKTDKHVGDILKCHYNQRRLVSPVDVAFGPAQISTLSDKYNAVPVHEPCEGSSRIPWNDVENIVNSVLEVQVDKFTLWTGASHYNANGIPRYLWKLAKFDDDEFEAIVYVNVPNPNSADILCSKHTSDNFSLPDTDQYTYSCNIDEFLESFKLPLSDFGITFK